MPAPIEHVVIQREMDNADILRHAKSGLLRPFLEVAVMPDDHLGLVTLEPPDHFHFLFFIIIALFEVNESGVEKGRNSLCDRSA